jgi:Mrp family chromosome partitioning ATPase
MIIERAIEKAKEMYRARAAAEAQPAQQAPAAPPDAGRPAQVRPDQQAGEQPIQPYREFSRVKLDAATCERNRILLEWTAQSELARADAAYRVLRSRVQNRIGTGKCSCIGITSPGPGEGKTVTALNLAISMVREKQRPVFLLDLDMRNPSVLNYLGAAVPVQISQFFLKAAAPEEVLFATDIDMLVIAGNRQPIEGASELLASHGLDDLISHIRGRSPNALIIIDLPPVISTDEALKVAPRVDAMFLVVSEGKTRRDALERSLGLLSDAKIAGIILNRSPESVGQYYYGN